MEVIRSRLQRCLIVCQYGVSIVLVISSLIIYRQLQYMQQKELGLNRQNVITVQTKDNSLAKNYENIRAEWEQYPGIISTTASTHLPINITSSHIINDVPGAARKMTWLFMSVESITISWRFLELP